MQTKDRVGLPANEPRGESVVIREMIALVDAPKSSDGPSCAAEEIADCLELIALAWPESCLSNSASSAFSEGSAGDTKKLDATWEHLATNLPQNGRFEIRRMLGHGGFGVVLLAFDRVLGREVALKVPRPDVIVTSGMRERFIREAQTAGALNHPAIVPIFDTGKLGHVWYIVSRYIAGPTLAELIERQQSLPAKAAAELTAQLADAVHHAHTRGILHRDLKPSNVLLELIDGPASCDFPYSSKLTDFGLAKRLESTYALTRQVAIVGTPRYMAPEQAANKQQEICVRTDVYGLGAVLFEALSGQAPFAADSDDEMLRKIQFDEVSSAPLRARNIPRDLETICLKCLAKKQAERYPSADDLAADLRRFLSAEPVHARPIGPMGKLLRWRRRRPLVALLCGLLALVVLIGIGGVVWQWQRAEQGIVLARQHAQRADENLHQIEHALLDLDFVFAEADLWIGSGPVFHETLKQKLHRYRETVAAQYPDQERTPKPILAAYHSLAGRSLTAEKRFAEAIERYQNSIRLWCEVFREDFNTSEYMHGFSMTLIGYAAAVCQSSAAGNDTLDFAAIQQIITELKLPEADDLEIRRQFARAMGELARARARRDKRGAGLPLFKLTGELWHDVGDRYPSCNWQLGESGAILEVAARTDRFLQQHQLALELAQKAQVMLEAFVPADADSEHASKLLLARAFFDGARYAAHCGQRDRAHEQYDEAIKVMRIVAPTGAGYDLRRQLANMLREATNHRLQNSSPLKAQSLLQECATIGEELLSANQLGESEKIRLAVVHNQLAKAHQLAQDEKQERAELQRCIALFESVAPNALKSGAVRLVCARSYTALGDLLGKADDTENAKRCYESAATVLKPERRRRADSKSARQLHVIRMRIEKLQSKDPLTAD